MVTSTEVDRFRTFGFVLLRDFLRGLTDALYDKVHRSFLDAHAGERVVGV